MQSRKTYPIGHPEIILKDFVFSVNTAMKKDPFQELGHLWSSLMLSLKGIQLSKLWYFRHTSETLFAEYVITFIKFKQEASGFPSHVMTDAYVKGYFEKEKIQLDIDKIALNPALRSINTFLLNALWGRVGLRCNLPTS